MLHLTQILTLYQLFWLASTILIRHRIRRAKLIRLWFQLVDLTKEHLLHPNKWSRSAFSGELADYRNCQ